MEVKLRKAFRSGNVIEPSVYTPGKKRIGHDEDSGVDIQSGQVACVDFSLGGVFGFANISLAYSWICYDH
ncbi:MAG: hypothetical protein ACI814_004538 [Mariniblastus sp.]|jgi:hypothetical protein